MQTAEHVTTTGTCPHCDGMREMNLKWARWCGEIQQGWAALAVQVEMALHWSLDQKAEPSVALHALRKYLAERPAPADALNAALNRTQEPEEADHA